MSGCGDDDLEGIAGAWDVSPASGVQWAQPPAIEPLPLWGRGWGGGSPCRGTAPFRAVTLPENGRNNHGNFLKKTLAFFLEV